MTSESESTARGLIIGTDGSVKDFTYTGYESLRGAVNGWIECVTSAVWENQHEYNIWGNEEGRLNGSANNHVARKIVAHMGDCHLDNVLTMHGDFVLLGCNQEGDSIGLPDGAIEFYKDFAVKQEDAEQHQEEKDEPFAHLQFGGGTQRNDRKEHMEWAKSRANEYLDKGERLEAIASFMSDLGKHPETEKHQMMMAMYSMSIKDDSIEATRKFINDFN